MSRKLRIILVSIGIFVLVLLLVPFLIPGNQFRPSIEVFGPVIAFAFCTLVVFVVLHSLQWIVAARLQSYAMGNLRQLDD